MTFLLPAVAQFPSLLRRRAIPFNNTNSGNDPYNRVWMASFSTTTPAYQIIAKLAALRQANDAVGYGTWKQRWISSDVLHLRAPVLQTMWC